MSKDNGKPKSYQEWLLHAGENEELGLQMLLTYSILRDTNKTITDRTFAMAKGGFERALFDKGFEPLTLTIDREDNPEDRAREIDMVLDTLQGVSLSSFAGYIYNQAETFWAEVQAWQNKSLWQYLKWWGKRTLRRV